MMVDGTAVPVKLYKRILNGPARAIVEFAKKVESVFSIVIISSYPFNNNIMMTNKQDFLY